MVEGRGELAYPRAVLDVVLAVEDDCGRRDGVVDVMMCRWKFWPLVVDPDDRANARTEGTTVRRHSSAPVEVEEVGLLAWDFMALHQKMQKMTEIPTVRNGKWKMESSQSSKSIVRHFRFGVVDLSSEPASPPNSQQTGLVFKFLRQEILLNPSVAKRLLFAFFLPDGPADATQRKRRLKLPPRYLSSVDLLLLNGQYHF